MTAPTAVAAGIYTLDAGRSTIGMSHKGMWGLITVRGSFTPAAGQVEVGADGSITGTLTIDAASVDTANDKRDEHLRSADFFDTARYPTITATASNAIVDGAAITVDAELTIRGVTRPQRVTATITQATGQAVTVSTEFTVDRTEYGIDWNKGGMLRGAATMTATLHFVRSAVRRTP